MILRIICILFVLSVAGVPTLKMAVTPADSGSAERGRYLVEGVAICFECHSERDYNHPGWPIQQGMKGSGRVLRFSPDLLVAPNITPERQTGIGTWTDTEIKRALTEGIARDGRRLDPEMPYRYYQQLSANDLQSIIQYLRQIMPVRHNLPRNRHIAKPAPEPGMDRIHSEHWSTEINSGEYLVRIGSCETCHTPQENGKYVPTSEFGGGVSIVYDQRKAVSSNITQDSTGILYYSENKFISVMRTGQIGARKLSSAMPWYFYKDMSDADLRAVYAYLLAIPPVKHLISNDEPCPRATRHECGN